MTDEILWQCNETELLEMARAQGLGRVRRGLPRQDLVAIVSGAADPTPAQLADTTYTRRKLQLFVLDNISRLRSQLPGCDGHCTTYPCSEIRHAQCFDPNERTIQ